MMKLLFLIVAAGLVLQGCGSSSGGPATPAAPAPGQAPSPGQPVPGRPSQPTQPTQPEGGNYFSDIDKAIAANATGDLFVAERFNILMSRLSVFALICDMKGQKGYSTAFSTLYNQSTELTKLSEKVYGSQPAAYNRFEKQRNIESRRLSFESGPNACALSQAAFEQTIAESASQIAQTLKTSPRGSL